MKPRSMIVTMCCALAVTAQFVSAKATRDALFLASLGYAALPGMLIATSVCSIALVALHAFASRRIAPATLVPAAFVCSALLFIGEWFLASAVRPTAAVLVYLHISAAGPLMASGFWLIASERFDPRSAKKRFGQIGGAGTIGGLVGAILAERMAVRFDVSAMLPVLAALQFISAGLVRGVASGCQSASPVPTDADDDSAGETQRSAVCEIIATPYLRNLAALVLFGTTSAALIDYLFKSAAVDTFGRGEHLLRFFAVYYAATSLVTFLVQTTCSRNTLERFGLAFAAGTPSFALIAGGIGGLVLPGFGSLLAARSGEAVLRGSLFRAGYELFYTPVASRQKRSAKAVIDVGVDRMGDALGGTLVRVLAVLGPAAQGSAILAAATVCSVLAVLVASRLNRGYISTLEHNLVNRGSGIDGPGFEWVTADNVMLSTFRKRAQLHERPREAETAPQMVRSVALDPEMQDTLHLRSRDRDRVVDVLSRQQGLSPVLVPHVIPLLAWEPVAEHAVFALRKVAEDHVGELVDALLDPNTDFSVRRRLARVLSVCVSQRAADGLMFGLEDPRFDVRYQSARSLSLLIDKNPLVRRDRELIEAAVLREVAVGRPVWESRRLLDGPEYPESNTPADAFVRQRAGASLAHVFTLLSLMLPREPLLIAFRSLYTDDQYLRGTALEYLEGVLPSAIRDGLWPYLEQSSHSRPTRPREEVIADLLRSHHSILMNLEQLRGRSGAALAEAMA